VEGYQAVKNHTKCIDVTRLARVHEEPTKLCGSMKAQEECVEPRAGKECMGPSAGNDRVCILYNEMTSINKGVPQIYTTRR